MHPDICGTAREVHYFDWNYHKSIAWYKKKLPHCLPSQILLEKSPKYFVHPDVPERIYRMNKTIKLLLIVRDPTERLISDFVHETLLKRTKHSFQESVLDNVNGGLNMSYEPVPTSIYVRHLKNYLRFFTLSQIHVIDGENFIGNPLPELQKVERLLAIRSFFSASHFTYSEKKGFYCKVVHGDSHCASKNKGRPHPKLRESIIKRCQHFYQPYNEQFFKVLNRKFNWA